MDPRQALACVEKQGLEASLKPTTNPSEQDPTAYLNVDAGKKTGISVAFFTDPAGARYYVDSLQQAARVELNPNHTELVDPTTALTVDIPGGVAAERQIVTHCL